MINGRANFQLLYLVELVVMDDVLNNIIFLLFRLEQVIFGKDLGIMLLNVLMNIMIIL